MLVAELAECLAVHLAALKAVRKGEKRVGSMAVMKDGMKAEYLDARLVVHWVVQMVLWMVVQLVAMLEHHLVR